MRRALAVVGQRGTLAWIAVAVAVAVGAATPAQAGRNPAGSPVHLELSCTVVRGPVLIAKIELPGATLSPLGIAKRSALPGPTDWVVFGPVDGPQTRVQADAGALNAGRAMQLPLPAGTQACIAYLTTQP